MIKKYKKGGDESSPSKKEDKSPGVRDVHDMSDKEVQARMAAQRKKGNAKNRALYEAGKLIREDNRGGYIRVMKKRNKNTSRFDGPKVQQSKPDSGKTAQGKSPGNNSKKPAGKFYKKLSYS